MEGSGGKLSRFTHRDESLDAVREPDERADRCELGDMTSHDLADPIGELR